MENLYNYIYYSLDSLTFIFCVILSRITYRIYRAIPYNGILWLFLAFCGWSVVRFYDLIQDFFVGEVITHEMLLGVACLFFLLQIFGFIPLLKAVEKYKNGSFVEKK